MKNRNIHRTFHINEKRFFPKGGRALALLLALLLSTAFLLSCGEEKKPDTPYHTGGASSGTPSEPAGSKEDSQSGRIAVQGVAFPYKSVTLKVGERIAVSAQISPANATDRTVWYKITDDSVISYEDGMVIAVAEGEAVLIAEADEDGYRDRLTVTVLSNGGQPTVDPSTETPTSPGDEDGWLLKETADAGMDYQNRLIFLGDSTTAGMIAYGVLPDGENTKQVWRGAVGNTVTFSLLQSVSIIYPETGESLSIVDTVKKAKPEYLVITLGVTGGVSTNIGKAAFVGLYEWLLSEIFKASPDTKVIVQSIFPVEENRNTPAGDYTRITIENIELYNGWIKDSVKKFYAEGKNVRYSDVYPSLLGSNGYLDPVYGNGDGLHIGSAGYEAILTYLRTHAWL